MFCFKRIKNEKKKSRGVFSASQKFDYYKKRLGKVRGGQLIYRSNWIDGFTDPHVRENYKAVVSEINKCKKNKVPFNDYYLSLIGYRNGLKAKLKNG